MVQHNPVHRAAARPDIWAPHIDPPVQIDFSKYTLVEEGHRVSRISVNGSRTLGLWTKNMVESCAVVIYKKETKRMSFLHAKKCILFKSDYDWIAGQIATGSQVFIANGYGVRNAMWHYIAMSIASNIRKAVTRIHHIQNISMESVTILNNYAHPDQGPTSTFFIRGPYKGNDGKHYTWHHGRVHASPSLSFAGLKYVGGVKYVNNIKPQATAKPGGPKPPPQKLQKRPTDPPPYDFDEKHKPLKQDHKPPLDQDHKPPKLEFPPPPKHPDLLRPKKKKSRVRRVWGAAKSVVKTVKTVVKAVKACF